LIIGNTRQLLKQNNNKFLIFEKKEIAGLVFLFVKVICGIMGFFFFK